jgi:hypothetical protein
MAFLDNLLTSDIGRTAVIPCAAAFVLALVIRAAGEGAGRRVAALALGLGFFAAYHLIDGIPAFPPPATKHKVFYVALAGLALGLALDLAGLARAGGHLFAFVLPAAALWWLRQNQIAAGPDAGLIATLAVLFLVSVVVYWRQAASARGSDAPEASSAALFPPIQVLAAAAGLGGIALLGVSLTFGSVGLALAAASGGFLLASYLVHLFSGRALGYGALGAFGAGGAWLALGFGATFEADAPIKRVLLGVVALAFVADFVARPFALGAPLGAGAFARLARPILYGVVVGIPPAAALAYAWFVLGWRMG